MIRQKLRGLVLLVLLVALPSPSTGQGLWHGSKEQRAQKAFAEAELLLAQGRLKAAEKHYRDAILNNPKLVKVFQRYTLFLHAQGRFDDGIRLLKLGIKLNPRSVELKAFLGMELCRVGRTKEAYGLFKASDVTENRYEIQAIVAQCALTVENYSAAVKAIRNYLKHRPATLKRIDRMIRVHLATALMLSGEPDRAEKELRAVLNQEPGHRSAQIAWAELKLERGRCIKALATFNRYLPRARDKTGMSLRIGRALLCLNRAKRALKIAERALAGHSTEIKRLTSRRTDRDVYSRAGKTIRKALLLRGNALSRLRRYDRALEDYDRLVKIERKERPSVVYRVALAYFSKKRYQVTLQRLSKELESDAPSSRVLVLALRAAVRSKKIVLARRCAERLLKLRSLQADHYYYAGIVHSSSGRFNEGATLFKKALTLDPEHKAARRELLVAFCYLGRRALKKGRPGEALIVLKHAEHVAPRSALVQRNLSLIYIKMKKYDRALSCARRALKADPKDLLAARLAARALAMLGRHSEALLKIKTALKEAEKLGDETRAKLLVESAFSSIHSDSTKTIKEGLAELKLALTLHGEKRAASIQRNIVRSGFLLGMQIYDKEEGTGWPELARAYRERMLLSGRERSIIAAGTALVAISTRKARLAQKMIKTLRDELGQEALVPGLNSAGHSLFVAYNAYLSEHLKTKLRGVRSIERLARSAPSPSKEMLKNLAGNGYEQIGYQSFRRGRSEQARLHLLRASRLREAVTIKMRHNIAVATYYAGTRKEGIATLEAIRNRVPLAQCNLGVDYEMRGSMIKAYNMFKQCLAKKVPFPGLTEIVDIKRQIFGGS